VSESGLQQLVSVILPCYNDGEWLGESIQSIIDQTYQKWELIIVDDGSTDQTASVAEKWCHKDSRIKLISISRKGIAEALNSGIEHANGKYIARQDADDLSMPKRLQKQAAYLDQHPQTGLVACKAKSNSYSEEYAGLNRWIGWNNQLKTHSEISRNRFVESPLIHPTVMFRKELVEKYGGYKQGDFPEDYELWLRWLEQKVKMEKLDVTGLIWRERPDRLTRTDERYSREAFFKIKAKYLAHWLKKHAETWPDITVWGNGRVTRKRASRLEEYGAKITTWIDIKKRDEVIYFEKLPEVKHDFIVSYVTNRGAREEIRRFLERHGYREEKDFILAG
jgi:glycosyltransferase involved in cell wall biosynthesis